MGAPGAPPRVGPRSSRATRRPGRTRGRWRGPGSPEAAPVKEVLTAEGLWSPYLEVGLGPDPEISTKAPVLSAVGVGAAVGVLERSVWNNPEPEVVLAVSSQGAVVGATLGNDVNRRDVEGRSALLLTEAKDNNASCALGPFVRLFDAGFGVEQVRALDVTLRVEGQDGFVLEAVSSMSEMSRDVLDLVSHAHGRHHRYPDDFALFTGTMFAPTEDRDTRGQGFTHHTGDVVLVSTPPLGGLVNTVDAAERAPEWTAGIRDLMTSLGARGLLGAGGRRPVSVQVRGRRPSRSAPTAPAWPGRGPRTGLGGPPGAARMAA